MYGKLAAISGIVFSGALALYVEAGWSQQTKPGDSSGGAAGSSSQSQSEPGQRGGSSQTESGTSMQQGRSQSGMSQYPSSGQWSQQNIKQVQEALKSQGHDPGPVDGVMGPNTRQALRSFQKSKNLQATGQLDSATASALGVSTSGMSSSSGGGGSSGMSGASPSGAGATSGRSGTSSSGASGTSSTGSKPSEPSLGTGMPDPKSGSGASTGTEKTGKSGSDR